MALQLTTTSALASLAGSQGDIYLNTTNNKLIVFHTSGVGNYDEFTDDGTLGASIELTFGNASGNGDTWYDSGSMGYYAMEGTYLDGYYKRYELQSDVISEIEALTDMSSGGSIPSSEIPGASVSGTNMAPFMCQSSFANAINAAYGNPLLFVYTGTVQNGPALSQSAAWTDGASSGTYYYVPVLYLINDAINNTAPMWGLNIVINEGSQMGFPSNSNPSSMGSGEWGAIYWGSGSVTAGNNESTIRQALTSEMVSATGGGNAANWTVDQTYVP